MVGMSVLTIMCPILGSSCIQIPVDSRVIADLQDLTAEKGNLFQIREFMPNVSIQLLHRCSRTQV